MLCYTVLYVLYCTYVYKKCSQDGVGTSPGATINSWRKKAHKYNFFPCYSFICVLFNLVFLIFFRFVPCYASLFFLVVFTSIFPCYNSIFLLFFICVSCCMLSHPTLCTVYVLYVLYINPECHRVIYMRRQHHHPPTSTQILDWPQSNPIHSDGQPPPPLFLHTHFFTGSVTQDQRNEVGDLLHVRVEIPFMRYANGQLSSISGSSASDSIGCRFPRIDHVNTLVKNCCLRFSLNILSKWYAFLVLKTGPKKWKHFWAIV